MSRWTSAVLPPSDAPTSTGGRPSAYDGVGVADELSSSVYRPSCDAGL
jgi:hypothetical protein